MTKEMSWQAVQAYLEERRRSVIEEIRAYPGPITGCDAQFNHLTAERRLLNAELARLDVVMQDGRETLGAFLRNSPVIDQRDFGQTSTTGPL